MPKRFLNVEYSGTRTRINVTGMEDLSELKSAIKAELANTLSQVDAPQLQLYDQLGRQIADLDDIPDDYYKKPKDGGLSLVIRTTPPPTRESSKNELFVAGLMPFLSAEEDLSRKRQRIEISSAQILELIPHMQEYLDKPLINSRFIRDMNYDEELTNWLKNFSSGWVKELISYENEQGENFEINAYKFKEKVLADDGLFPNYLFERSFQKRMFDKIQMEKNCILIGNPGISKSVFQYLFLFYICNPNEFDLKPKGAPKVVIRQIGKSDIQLFFIQEQIAFTFVDYRVLFEICKAFKDESTVYLFEPSGEVVHPYLEAKVRTIATVSPLVDRYKEFQKKSGSVKYFMPVWDKEEMMAIYDYFSKKNYFTARERVDPSLYKRSEFERRLDLFGGIFRHVFILAKNELIKYESIQNQKIIAVDTNALFNAETIENEQISNYIKQFCVLKDGSEYEFLPNTTTLEFISDSVKKKCFEKLNEVKIKEKVSYIKRKIETRNFDETARMFIQDVCVEKLKNNPKVFFRGPFKYSDLKFKKMKNRFSSNIEPGSSLEEHQFGQFQTINREVIKFSALYPKLLVYPNPTNFPLVDLYFVNEPSFGVKMIMGIQVSLEKTPRSIHEQTIQNFYKLLEIPSDTCFKYVYFNPYSSKPKIEVQKLKDSSGDGPSFNFNIEFYFAEIPQILDFEGSG